MNWRILLKNCEASLGELNPLEGLKTSNRVVSMLEVETSWFLLFTSNQSLLLDSTQVALFPSIVPVIRRKNKKNNFVKTFIE